MNKIFNIIIAGVGGQGLVTLTQILAEAALIEGYDVKTSELHGLSQRGGSVETHIRFGKKAYTPLIDYGKADFILGLEIQEGLRMISFANKRTIFVINDNYFSYFNGLKKEEVYKRTKSLLKKRLYLIPASDVCKKELTNEVVSGIYLLGYCAFKKLIPLKSESILEAIRKVVPEKYLELNIKAFNLAKENG
jgi:indolepyruvate ferredoxin oxidoreductase beta subunit